jgi:cyanophycin synthetase
MRLAEIRDLDGPNLFMLRPAIKIEIVLEAGDSEDGIAERLDAASAGIDLAAASFIGSIHAANRQPSPDVVVRRMDDPGHLSIAYSWQRRAFALAVAQHLVDVLNGSVDPDMATHFAHALERSGEDDRPAMVTDAERSAIAISVTGTNGKTTTTRLIAHLMRTAGFRTGWNSSSGIYVEGEEIEAGDYSGPSGARTILRDPSVQAAVLETARGGILLRGLGYEHNDVSVFTNVSADHLELHGVRTLETLAEVKAVVCRVTKPDGLVVVNADDPLVMTSTTGVVAERLLVTQKPGSDIVEEHIARGGKAIRSNRHEIEVREGDAELATFTMSEVPMTYDGRARHMVENAICGIGAAIGAGLTIAQIRAGLRSFRNDSAHNPGRLNVYRCRDFTIVLDYAHNEAGLAHLIEFGKGELGPRGRLIAIIGTAGDRTDHSLSELGRIAAEACGLVIAKGTDHYLRGRSLDNLMAMYRSGAARHPETPYLEAESESTAVDLALEHARDGDVIVMMMQELIPGLIKKLESLPC